MENLKIYEKVRAVPETAKKRIGAGRLKGMTDINPMWRIKVLTETFGPCGEGWYYEIEDRATYPVPNREDADEIVAVVEIDLFYKLDNGEWSKPVHGTGGSKLMTQEKNGTYVNDEAFKMALTDAISVACKALGVGADVYWNSDNTKYIDQKKMTDEEKALLKEEQKAAEEMEKQISAKEAKDLKAFIETKGADEKVICDFYKVADVSALTKAQYGQVVRRLMSK